MLAYPINPMRRWTQSAALAGQVRVVRLCVGVHSSRLCSCGPTLCFCRLVFRSTHTLSSLSHVGDGEQVRPRIGDDFVLMFVQKTTLVEPPPLFSSSCSSSSARDHELQAAESSSASPRYTEPRIPGAIGRIFPSPSSILPNPQLRSPPSHTYDANTMRPHCLAQGECCWSFSWSFIHLACISTTFAFAVIFHRMESPVRRKIEAIGRSMYVDESIKYLFSLIIALNARPVSRRLPALHIV